MQFDDLDRKLRVFETAHDHCVLPGIYIVARLDGRSFARLTGEICQFDKPFDVRFRDHMIVVTQHVMTCGARLERARPPTHEGGPVAAIVHDQ
jgi:tRNA(His) guanylyltransferase